MATNSVSPTMVAAVISSVMVATEVKEATSKDLLVTVVVKATPDPRPLTISTSPRVATKASPHTTKVATTRSAATMNPSPAPTTISSLPAATTNKAHLVLKISKLP